MEKILFLVTQSEFGGAQRYVYEVVKGLGDKYEILIVTGEGDNELVQKISNLKSQNPKLQLKTQSLKYLKRAPLPWYLILSIWEIRNLLKKERPDVLFLCSTTAGLLGSIAAVFGSLVPKLGTKLPKPKIIYRIGGWAFRDPRPSWQNWIILLAEKLTAPLKDKIIVNSELDRNLALKHKIASPEKIVKIYNGIDINSLDFLSREEARSWLKPWLKPGFNQLMIGCVANFYKTKGLEYLIEAIKLVEARLQPTKLVIIGEGRLRPQLETQIKKLGLEDKVILTGRIPDAYKYLKAFDVFVLPSLKEGFPWVILEAIAAGVPIVATKVGALPEILDEEFLVEPGNTGALAKKISRMLERPAAPRLKQGFTIKTMLQKTDQLLQEEH